MPLVQLRGQDRCLFVCATEFLALMQPLSLTSTLADRRSAPAGVLSLALEVQSREHSISSSLEGQQEKSCFMFRFCFS